MMNKYLKIALILLGVTIASPTQAMHLQDIVPLATSDPLSQDGNFITVLKFQRQEAQELDERWNQLLDQTGTVTLYDDDGWLSMMILTRLWQEEAEQEYHQKYPEGLRDDENKALFYQEFAKRPINQWGEAFKPLLWRSVTKLYNNFLKSPLPSFGPAADDFKILAKYIGPRLFKNVLPDTIFKDVCENPDAYEHFLTEALQALQGKDQSSSSEGTPIQNNSIYTAQLIAFGKIALLENLVLAHHKLLWTSAEIPTYETFFSLFGNFFEITSGSREYFTDDHYPELINPHAVGLSDYLFNSLDKKPRTATPLSLTVNGNQIIQSLSQSKSVWMSDKEDMKATSLHMLEDFPNISKALALE